MIDTPTTNGRATPIEQAMHARVAEQAQRRTMMHPDAEIDADVLERLAAAESAVRDAHERVRAAEYGLAQHQQAMPDAPDGVSDWARRKTELAAELEAFEALRDRAQVVRDTAQAAVDEAYRVWFREQHDAGVAAWRTSRSDGQHELAEMERAKQERMVTISEQIKAKGAYVNDLRRYLPKGVTIHMLATDEEGIRGSFGL